MALLPVARPWGMLADRFAPVAAGPPGWRQIARPKQLPPETAWFIWLILAGRGWGKTLTGAQWVAEQARTYPGCRIALVAATFADGRDTMVEGETGLLAALRPEELRGGNRDRAWNRSLGELFLANGSRLKVFSSERPRQLRGPQHHFAWADEPMQWNDAKRGARAAPEVDTTWSNLVIGLRLQRRPGWPEGYAPRIVATTTPKRVQLLKNREEDNPGLLQQPGVEVTTGRTDENLANLAESYVAAVVEPLRGTRLGQQELDAVLLEDVEGALWKGADIERGRLLFGDVLPRLHATVVGVDPAVTAKESSDWTGVVVCASDLEGHGYVLDDRTLKASPRGWATAVWRAAIDWNAEAVVIEDNQGKDMVEHTLTTVWPEIPESATRLRPKIHRVHAGASKRVRALPIATRYERQPPTIHHVQGAGDLTALVEEMTGWDGSGSGDSPDRIDALVWALTYLLLPGQAKSSGSTVVRQERWGAVAGGR